MGTELQLPQPPLGPALSVQKLSPRELSLEAPISFYLAITRSKVREYARDAHSVVNTFFPTPFFPNASSRLVIVPDAERIPLRSFDR